MDELQIIKAEVERLKGSGCASPISVCNDLISFIESLQKEHASESIDDLEISCDAELCFAHTGCKFYNPNKKSNVNHCIGGIPLQLRQQSVSDDLEKVAEDYANKHSVLLGFDCDSEPIQTGTDIKNAVIYGAEWQRKLDADLGSPAYERGFTNGWEFERKNRKDLAKELELVKSWFDDIVEKSSRLTTGNVAHLGKNIRGFAGHYSEYVNDLIKEG